MRTAKLLASLLVIAGAALVAFTPVAARAQDASAIKQVGLVRTGSGTFSIDVEGADIRTVVRAVGEFSGRNIVVAKEVQGKVRVALKNVGWQDALRTILRSNGLDYVEENGILRVDEMAKLQQEAVERETAKAKQMELVPLETRVVRLNFATASELTTAMQGSLTRRGSILVEKRTNSLIVSDLPGRLDDIEKMARSLDSATPEVEITAKLVDVDSGALRGLGIEWGLGLGETSEYFSGAPAPSAPMPGPGQFIGAEHKTPADKPATRVSYGIFQKWGSIEAQLQMLEENHKAKIISNPRITTVDNREARIVVGQKIPLIVQDVAGNPLSQLQTIGIQLRVTPHITSDRRIVMDLHPEVSDLASQSTVQGGVIINTSEADTRVMVEDGQTAVIGGLIRSNETEVRRGVPLLKDIPLLGVLFRSNATAQSNRELLIFVTPRITNPVAVNPK